MPHPHDASSSLFSRLVTALTYTLLFTQKTLALSNVVESGARHTCAPITNGWETWANFVSNNQSRCVQKYDPKAYNPECNTIMAYASAESGDNYVNDLGNSSYAPYVNCSFPHGKATWDCVPSAIVQAKLFNAYGAVNNNRVLLIGGNDFFNNIEKIISILSRLGHPDKMTLEVVKKHVPPLSHLLDNIKKWVSLQLSAGVPKNQIFVSTLLDFSKVPATIKLAKGSKLVLGAIQALSFVLNHAIISSVKSLLPERQVLAFHKWVSEILSHPEQYGFKADLKTKSCVDDGAAPDCSGYVFFNSKHPTVAAHKILSAFVPEEVKSKPIVFFGDSLTDTGSGRSGSLGNNIWCGACSPG